MDHTRFEAQIGTSDTSDTSDSDRAAPGIRINSSIRRCVSILIELTDSDRYEKI